MNILVIFTLIGCVFAFSSRRTPTHIDSRDLIGSLINGSLEGFKPLIPDPLEFDFLEITLPPNPVLEGIFSASHVALYGFRDFHFKDMSVNLLGLQINFVVGIDELKLITDYSGDLQLHLDEEDAVILGKGDLSGSLYGLEVSASAKLDLSAGFHVKDLAVRLTIEGNTVKIEDSIDPQQAERISAYFNQNLTGLIDDNVEEISKACSPVIEELLNYIFDLIFPEGQ